MTLPARDQQVDDLPRVRTAINVVAEENLDCLGDRSRFEIVVDAREKLRTIDPRGRGCRRQHKHAYRWGGLASPLPAPMLALSTPRHSPVHCSIIRISQYEHPRYALKVKLTIPPQQAAGLT